MNQYTCAWKDLPTHLKTKAALNQVGLTTIDKPVAQLILGKTYDLYDERTAIPLTFKNAGRYEIKNWKKGLGKDRTRHLPIDHLPVYDGMSPQHAKTETKLYRSGFKPVGQAVAVLKQDGKYHALYAVEQAEPLSVETALPEELRYWLKGLEAIQIPLTLMQRQLKEAIEKQLVGTTTQSIQQLTLFS